MVKLDVGYFTDAPALTLIDLHFVCELSIQYNGLLYYTLSMYIMVLLLMYHHLPCL